MSKNAFFLISFMFFLSISINAQVYTIFLDDTSFYSAGIFNYNFKDSLADGTWILHDLYRKDSVKIEEQTIVLIGTYKDYKKEETFNYYTYRYSIGKRGKKPYWQYYVQVSETYKSGLLNGMTIISGGRDKKTLNEVMYENGKKNGLDVSYHYGKYQPYNINYYSHDTLINGFYYYEDKKNTLHFVIMRLDNGEYKSVIYDSIGQKKIVAYYDNIDYTMYKWQKYYPNQIMEKEKEGHFLQSIKEIVFDRTRDYDHDIPDWDNVILISGTARLYNQNGDLIEEKEVSQSPR